MKKIMILTCMSLFFCSMFSFRTLIHASENVAFSIGGKINNYVEVYDYDSTTQHKVNCECGKHIRYEEHVFIPYSSQAVTPLLVPITNYVCTKCGYVKSVYPNV